MELDRRDEWAFKETQCNENVYREFTLESQTFSFLRWLKYWIILNAFSFQFGLHVQSTTILMCLILVSLVGIVLKVHFKVKRESLLVISSLGIQVTTTFMSGRRLVQFYDMSLIKDLVINEGITMQSVIFYLAILLKKKEGYSIVPLFTHSWPRLKVLQRIYQGAQEILKRS